MMTIYFDSWLNHYFVVRMRVGGAVTVDVYVPASNSLMVDQDLTDSSGFWDGVVPVADEATVAELMLLGLA